MGKSLAVAFGMMCLLEGIVPLLFPKQWRAVFNRVAQFSNGQIRFVGLMALLCGATMFGFIQLFS